MSTSVAIFFFAGDFCEALRRHREGEQQLYATHDEVAALICGLVERGVAVTIYSYVTPEARIERPLPGVTIVSMGARDYAQHALLRDAVAAERSEALVLHFPNRVMLRAGQKTGKRILAVLASSFYRRSLLNYLERFRLARVLNNRAIELVANHCEPATRHLARLGVRPDKLIAWDIPHRYSPADTTPKTLPPGGPPELLYVGAITAAKGVVELIEAIVQTPARLSLAGGGDVAQMTALARQLGVEDRVRFLGQVGNDDVFRLMRDADAIVIPSRAEFQEGLPLVMFEAVASHTPIICSDHPIFTAFMRDGENAQVFRSGDADHLARAITGLFDDPARYARLSDAADGTWQELGRTADWRRLIETWLLDGPDAVFIRDRTLAAQTARCPSISPTTSRK